MGKAWNKITNFFRGGTTPKGPTSDELYSGPGANWNARFNEDGTISSPTRTTRFGRTISRGYVPMSARVRGNQTGTQAAMEALANTRRVASTGWTSQDRAAFGAADRASQRSARAAIQALAQQSRARGTQNSGAAFAAAAGAAQSGANAAADRGVDIAARGAARKDAANQAMAGLGLGLDSQAFGQGMQRAGAVDEFNRYATGARAGALQQSYDNRRQYEADEAERRQRMFGQVMQIGSQVGSMFGGD